MATEQATEAPRATNVFVVLNPRSGRSDAGVIRGALDRHLAGGGAAYRVHEPSHDDPLADRVNEAVRGGCDLVVAAGGDGTVSSVADALAGAGGSTPLGIIPLGTANVLAGELGIPFDPEEACRLLAGDHALARIDVMELAGKHYVTQVGVGLDAEMIRDTPDERKRRFGRVAYVWTAVTRILGFRRHRFTLEVDGRTTRVKGMQVLVANSGTLGQRPFRWGEDIRPDDGRLDVCVIHAQSLAGLVALGWHFVRGRHRQAPDARYLAATREVTVSTARPMPVQADGEIVGETPVTVRIVPGAVRVVVPRVSA